MLGRSKLARLAAAQQHVRRAPLVRVLDRDEVRVHFQPVVRLTDGATIGYEALARLGQRAEVPGPWFRLAREVGLGLELELGCLSAIAAAGLPPDDGLLFVNVSPDTLVHPRMAELCEPLAARLVVELTEHDEVRDYEPLRPSLQRWRSRGVRLAVDDTGAGYSSLRHVLELAPHFLKLDRTVIGGLDEHAARRALVAALVTFAEDVGTTIIAEGVERWEEAEALREVGVHLAQGYVFGRPEVGFHPAPWPSAAEGDEFARRLAAARELDLACEVICEHLAARAPLLPSVYLEREGRLRCRAQRGHWQVLDGLPIADSLMACAYRDGEVLVVEGGGHGLLAAAPGISSQCSAPVRVDGRTVGVVNVVSVRDFAHGDASATAEAADALSAWLERHAPADAAGPDARLAVASRSLSSLREDAFVERALVRSATAIASMSSAVLFRPDSRDRLERRASDGPLALAFHGISADDLDELRLIVAGARSFHTGTEPTGHTLPATEKLRRAGVQALVVVGVEHPDQRLPDLLVVVDGRPLQLEPGALEALERLAHEAGRALTAPRTIDLDQLAGRSA